MTVLGRDDFASSAAAFFALQAPLLAGAALAFRRLGARAQSA